MISCDTVFRNVRRILVRGFSAPLPPEAKKIMTLSDSLEFIGAIVMFFYLKFDYEMVHFEVYLNKYVVSIAPFSASACPVCSQNMT